MSGVQQPGPRGQLGGDINDGLVGGSQALGDAATETGGAFDRPLTVRPLLSPYLQPATVSRLTSSRIVALTSPVVCTATAVSELLWGSIPMVITGYLRVAVMGSPTTGNLT